MGDGGKGSRARPYSVDQKIFHANWDAIFGRKSTLDPDPQSVDDDILKKENKENES